MGFLKTLAKVGLVELDEEERVALSSDPQPMEPSIDDAELQRLLAEEAEIPDFGAEPQTAGPAPAPAPPTPSGGTASGPAENRPFEEIYAEAGVPISPFPAEKLLKLLEGLKAMDPATRKVAVLAMDAADDDWTVADAVLDAQRKAKALREAENACRASLTAVEQQVDHELAEHDRYREQATASIRQQIADLEALLEEELRKVAENKAQAQASLRAHRDAYQREVARCEAEIGRLLELTTMFASAEA